MANSKNTIQNIPLEGELCMNSLKTEVKPFAGYNEKNTTFYGGTLSPIYDKTTELFDKNNSYTFFNSKGEAFTISRGVGTSSWLWRLRKGNSVDELLSGQYLHTTEKLDVPPDCVIATKCPDGDTLYVSQDGLIIKGGVNIGNFGLVGLTDARVWFVRGCTIVLVVGADERLFTHFQIYRFSPNANPLSTFAYPCGENSFFSGVFLDGDTEHFIITSYETNGLNKQFDRKKTRRIKIALNSMDYSDLYRVDDIPIESLTDTSGTVHKIIDLSSIQNLYSFNIQQFAFRYITTNPSEPHFYKLWNNSDFSTHEIGYVGVNGDDVQCPLGFYPGQSSSSSSYFSVYYQNNSLISIGHYTPIDTCLSYANNIITRCRTSHTFMISYKKNDGNWYCFNEFDADDDKRLQGFKNLVWDNRYVIGDGEIYDTETGRLIKNAFLDWIISIPPYTKNVSTSNLTGYVYAAGTNAGYTISGLPFVGYLPNPFIGTGITKNEKLFFETVNMLHEYEKAEVPIQWYCSVGDTAQSAEYKGNDLQYQGTIYPIDPNGNVVLPISSNAQLIKGYSNNDLVKEGNTVYPLLYWNNNQKIYAYMLLSGMENITNAFSLQGQQYTVDDDNIYAVSFNAGVIQNATAVAYKKNLTFLGTLPTQAVFWSDFNKTFYAFTGDRILSRMFEASDINKIEYVGQNPATLSLWICTDDGIYVLSDKDMFKLDYNSKQVAFYSKNAFIVTEGDTNNEVHTISLYLNDDEQGEMIPVKLQTAYYGLGSEQKAVMDCWYLRLFDKDRTEGYVKVKVNTITDVTRHTEEKTFNINPSDYDDNNIVYIRYQPKYQECVSMQLELETNLGIYQISLGVNTTDSTAQVSKFNF